VRGIYKVAALFDTGPQKQSGDEYGNHKQIHQSCHSCIFVLGDALPYRLLDETYAASIRSFRSRGGVKLFLATGLIGTVIAMLSIGQTESLLREIRLALICFCPSVRARGEASFAVSAESVPSYVRLGHPSILS
jgi:hypothetical protein